MTTIPTVQRIRSTTDVGVGDFLKETIVTNSIVYTIAYEVVSLGRTHLVVRRCAEGEVVRKEKIPGRSRTKTWNRAVPNMFGQLIYVPQDKDGFPMRETKNYLKKAALQDGRPINYTEALF